MTGKIVLSIALAAACAYLYWKIQKRKRAAEEAAKAAEKPDVVETAETALQKVRAHFDDENTYQHFLRSKCTLDAKHDEPACAGGTCGVEVEEVEIETQVEKKEPAPVVRAKVAAKPKRKSRARKAVKAQTVIDLDEPQTVGEEK